MIQLVLVKKVINLWHKICDLKRISDIKIVTNFKIHGQPLYVIFFAFLHKFYNIFQFHFRAAGDLAKCHRLIIFSALCDLQRI